MRAAVLILVLTGAEVAPATIDADANVVLQVKQSFLPTSVVVPAGTTVTFTNADDVSHNLQTKAPGASDKVDHGVEKPGESTLISFPTVGDYTVTCAIHPKMKMKVTVQ